MSAQQIISIKRCSKCGKEKSIECFGVEARRPDGRRCFCRQCGSVQYRSYRSTSVTFKRYQRQYRKKRNLVKRYGITLGQYQKRLEDQCGRCAICGTSEPAGRWGTFHVDHDHGTGAVRGLLCQRCNHGLSFFGDDLSGFERVVAYLSGGLG